MAVCYRSFGSCTITAGGSLLGIADSNGVRAAITEFNVDVYSDEFGPNVPATVLRNGSTAEIKFVLSKYDSAVLATLFAAREGGVIGQQGTIGELLYNGCTNTNRTQSWVFTSTVTGNVWTFPQAWIVDEASVVLSTQQEVWDLTVRATPNSSGVLYTETIL